MSGGQNLLDRQKVRAAPEFISGQTGTLFDCTDTLRGQFTWDTVQQ